MVSDDLAKYLAMSRLLVVVNMGNQHAGVSSCKRLTWASLFMWRQNSKSLRAEAIELLKGQIQGTHDIKASNKARPCSKGREIDSMSLSKKLQICMAIFAVYHIPSPAMLLL